MNANTPADALRHVDLLEPVSADAPCGIDLEYDPAFVMLQAAVAPRVEAQYGDFVDVPSPANWTEIERDCRALLLRTKDIRIVAILLRCRVRLDGALGLRDGLAALKTLFERYGKTLYPLPITDGEPDPIAYANAIAALADPDGLLGDIRDIAMPRAAGLKLHLRDIEKSFATPRQKDALAPESVTRALKELGSRHDATLAAFVEAECLANDIATWCINTLGDDAPDLDTLSKLLRPFAQPQLDGGGMPSLTVQPRVEPTDGDTPATASVTRAVAAVSAAASATTHAPVTAAVPVADRWQVLATIRDARMWFEQNEPSSPVAVLLRQSERMVGKRFSELAHVIPADLLSQWDEIDS